MRGSQHGRENSVPNDSGRRHKVKCERSVHYKLSLVEAVSLVNFFVISEVHDAGVVTENGAETVARDLQFSA